MWLARAVFSTICKALYVSYNCSWQCSNAALSLRKAQEGIAKPFIRTFLACKCHIQFRSTVSSWLLLRTQRSTDFVGIFVQVDNFFISERRGLTSPFTRSWISSSQIGVCFSMQQRHALESLILAWELFKWKICLNRTAKNGWLLYQYRACCLTIAAFTLKLLG